MDLSRRGLLAGIIGAPFARAFKAAEIQSPKPIPNQRGISLPVVPAAPHVITISDGKRRARIKVTRFQVDSWSETIDATTMWDDGPHLMVGHRQCDVAMTAYYDAAQFNRLMEFMAEDVSLTVSRADGGYRLIRVSLNDIIDQFPTIELELRRIG